MLDQHHRQDITRRRFLLAAAFVVGAPVLPSLRRVLEALGGTSHQPLEDVVIVEFSDAGTRQATVRVPKVVRTDGEWRKQLPPLAFEVTRHGDTERPFSGAYWNLHAKGLFRCVCCDTALFSSQAKFDSGTGWPSFWQPIAEENVRAPKGQTEVTCRRCDAHLGDLFDDGPKPTGLRYCIDSVALRFIKSV